MKLVIDNKDVKKDPLVIYGEAFQEIVKYFLHKYKSYEDSDYVSAKMEQLIVDMEKARDGQ